MLVTGLRGFQAALLRAHEVDAASLFAVQETTITTFADAEALFLPKGVAYSVLTEADDAARMAAVFAESHAPGFGKTLVFWNTQAYDDDQQAVVALAIAHHRGTRPVVVHAQDTLPDHLNDLLVEHCAFQARFDLTPTPVLFRAEKSGDFKGEVTAVFPTLPGTNNPYTFTVYAHIGQHSSGSLEWYHTTRAATPEEYTELAQELESRGYVLDIRRRWSRTFDAERRDALAA